MDRVSSAGLSIARELHDFVNTEALPGTGLEPDAFWSGLAGILAELAPRTAALLAVRDDSQAKIDAWHVAHKGKPHDAAAYEAFLRQKSADNASIGLSDHSYGAFGQFIF